MILAGSSQDNVEVIHSTAHGLIPQVVPVEWHAETDEVKPSEAVGNCTDYNGSVRTLQDPTKHMKLTQCEKRPPTPPPGAVPESVDSEDMTDGGLQHCFELVFRNLRVGRMNSLQNVTVSKIGNRIQLRLIKANVFPDCLFLKRCASSIGACTILSVKRTI